MTVQSTAATSAGAAPVFAAIAAELGRQQTQIELIASENIVSRDVLTAQGSVFTNKYAEGYPGRRYYGGCEHADVVESIAIDRVTALFGCRFANVQPHSGAQANTAVLMALLKPGDTLLGMSLSAGGHLTHGAAPTLSGKWFDAIGYGVRREDALIDYEEVERLAREHRPKLIICGGSSYPRAIDFALPRHRRRRRRHAHGRRRPLCRPDRRRRLSLALPAPMSSPRPPTRRFAVRVAA